jgi:hypothetical protein
LAQKDSAATSSTHPSIVQKDSASTSSKRPISKIEPAQSVDFSNEENNRQRNVELNNRISTSIGIGSGVRYAGFIGANLELQIKQFFMFVSVGSFFNESVGWDLGIKIAPTLFRNFGPNVSAQYGTVGYYKEQDNMTNTTKENYYEAFSFCLGMEHYSRSNFNLGYGLGIYLISNQKEPNNSSSVGFTYYIGVNYVFVKREQE